MVGQVAIELNIIDWIGKELLQLCGSGEWCVTVMTLLWMLYLEHSVFAFSSTPIFKMIFLVCQKSARKTD